MACQGPDSLPSWKTTLGSPMCQRSKVMMGSSCNHVWWCSRMWRRNQTSTTQRSSTSTRRRCGRTRACSVLTSAATNTNSSTVPSSEYLYNMSVWWQINNAEFSSVGKSLFFLMVVGIFPNANKFLVRSLTYDPTGKRSKCYVYIGQIHNRSNEYIFSHKILISKLGDPYLEIRVLRLVYWYGYLVFLFLRLWGSIEQFHVVSYEENKLIKYTYFYFWFHVFDFDSFLRLLVHCLMLFSQTILQSFSPSQLKTRVKTKTQK